MPLLPPEPPPLWLPPELLPLPLWLAPELLPLPLEAGGGVGAACCCTGADCCGATAEPPELLDELDEPEDELLEVAAPPELVWWVTLGFFGGVL